MSNAILNLIRPETKKEEVLKSYETYPDTQPKGFEQFHASTVEPIFCEIPERAKVLDVGCNSGEMMKLLRDAKKCDCMGVDISEGVLELARAKGLNVLKADAEALPFPDSSFDVVILREVLVHLFDPVKALKEIKRVLRPSGFLLGSAPHANLERIVWDDKRLHHRYYDEESLKADLAQAFDVTHLRILKGGQFAVKWAGSMLGDQPAEMLFKCGGKDTPDWETTLLSDKETLRVWMGPTQPPGDAYYRLIGLAAKMRGMPNTEIAFENFRWEDRDSCSEWQRKIIRGREGNVISSLALDTLNKCLKIANPWIFQISYYDDVVSFLECAKDLYKGKKLITEVDDWLFDVPSYNIASHPYRPNSEKENIAYDQLELSDVIVVSTSFIKENLATMFPGKPIYVIPNSIDFSFWDNAKPFQPMEKKEGVVRIGYSGCGNHSGDLELVKPVFLALLNEYPNLEIIVVQDFESLKDIKHERFIVTNKWVSMPDYPGYLKGWDMDIGIAPLRDNNFNRAKSNLRWLEYSALQIPTVASAVRPFKESVTNGIDGILCSSTSEWYAQLKHLIENKDARERFGKAGYKTVKERFNMDLIAERYRKLLLEINNELPLLK